jgi:hypothetical protein
MRAEAWEKQINPPHPNLAPKGRNKFDWYYISKKHRIVILGNNIYSSIMSHSLSNILVHIVFSTKERRAWLDDIINNELKNF